MTPKELDTQIADKDLDGIPDRIDSSYSYPQDKLTEEQDAESLLTILNSIEEQYERQEEECSKIGNRNDELTARIGELEDNNQFLQTFAAQFPMAQALVDYNTAMTQIIRELRKIKEELDMDRKALDAQTADKDLYGIPDRIDSSYSYPQDAEDPLDKLTVYESSNINGLAIEMFGDGSGYALLGARRFADIELSTNEIKFQNDGWEAFDLGKGSEKIENAMLFIEDYAVKKLGAKALMRYASVTPALCDYLQKQGFSFSKCKTPPSGETIIQYPVSAHQQYQQLTAAFQQSLKKGRSQS